MTAMFLQVALMSAMILKPHHVIAVITIKKKGANRPYQRRKWAPKSVTFMAVVQVGGIIVDVNLSEHSATIRFSEYHDGAAPFLIINHTKDQTLLFHQR